MKNEQVNQHRGEHLNYIVHKRGIAIETLTRAVKVHRTTFYNHIKNPRLSLVKLAKYGEFLQHDFYADYIDKPKNRDEEDSDSQSYDSLKEERDHWRDKYFEIYKLYVKLKDSTENSEATDS